MHIGFLLMINMAILCLFHEQERAHISSGCNIPRALDKVHDDRPFLGQLPATYYIWVLVHDQEYELNDMMKTRLVAHE